MADSEETGSPTGVGRDDGPVWPGSAGYRPAPTTGAASWRFWVAIVVAAAACVAGGLAPGAVLGLSVGASCLLVAASGAVCGAVAARRRVAVVGLFVTTAVVSCLVVLPLWRQVFAPHRPEDGEDWLLLTVIVVAIFVPMFYAVGYTVAAFLTSRIGRRRTAADSARWHPCAPRLCRTRNGVPA